MALTPGTRLGPYEIAAKIGEGGMGEVYRARDTKLNRDVALKVLPESFLHDADRLARFQREAHVLASLNHPNIAAIYGLEEGDGTRALVMELVEGPTLQEILAGSGLAAVGSGKNVQVSHGQSPKPTAQGLPFEDALPIARQIADALEAAHEQSIIHRDLKPANIKVRDDGVVKVLDFGLAKAIGPAEAGPYDKALSQAPTITTPAMMTGVGVILGTAAYMSPEQAKGREVDKRSDVWAFGCVLYEMLTGHRPFEDTDISETLAAVLKSDPDWERIPADVPQAIRTLIQRCLVKDRRQRVSDISAAKFVLSELGNMGARPIGAASAAAVVAPRSRWQRLLPPAVAAALTAIIVGAGGWALRPASRPPVVAQFSFTLPVGQVLSGNTRQNVAISPDGTRVIYSANSRIYLRSIGELEPHVIQGTENTTNTLIMNPMFAPDGQSVAFFSQNDGASASLNSSGVLRRVPIGGGTASTIGTMELPLGASWSSEGILIGQARGILRVAQTGGALELIARVAQDERAFGPQMLPGGRTVLFSVVKNVTFNEGGWDKAQVVAQSLTDGTRRVLIDGGSDARYLPSGHLVYAVAGTMFAAPFDLGSLTVTSAPVPVIVGVRRATGLGTAATHLAFSETGTLVYEPGPATTSSAAASLVLGDGRGDPVPLKVPPGEYVHPRVSPDGSVFAVGRNNGQESDIWIYDLSEKTEMRRLTFGGNNRFPVWSGDGRRVTFQSAREGDRAIFWQSADGTDAAVRLSKPAQGEEHRPESWSRDGTRLLFSVVKDAKFSLWVLTLDAKKAEPFGGVQSAEPSSASFSPDGRWVAYAFAPAAGGILSSNRGIFVQPFPATGQMHQAPKKFIDFHPVWAPDGKGIFYVQGATRPTVLVPISTRPAVAFGTPEDLPRGPQPGLTSTNPWGRGYDVLPDGRFVSLAPASGDGTASAPSNEIRVVLNWTEELKRLVPVNK